MKCQSDNPHVKTCGVWQCWGESDLVKGGGTHPLVPDRVGGAFVC